MCIRDSGWNDFIIDRLEKFAERASNGLVILADNDAFLGHVWIVRVPGRTLHCGMRAAQTL